MPRPAAATHRTARSAFPLPTAVLALVVATTGLPTCAAQAPELAVRQLDKTKNWNSIASFAFSPDGKLLAGGMSTFRINDRVTGGNVVLWTLKNGKVRRELTGHQNAITAVAFTADGKHVVSFSDADGEVRRFDTKRGRERNTFRVEALADDRANVPAVLTPDGTALVRFGQETLDLPGNQKSIVGALQVWDVETGKLRWQRERTFAETVAVSPDGSLVAYYAQELNYEIEGGKVSYSSPNSVVRVLRLRDGELVQTVDVGYMPLDSLGFSPDNATLFAVNETFRRYGVADGKQIGDAVTHDGPDDWLRISADGTRAVTGSVFAPRVLSWQLGESGAAPTELALPADVQNPMGFSADLQRLACAIGGDPMVLELAGKKGNRGRRR